MEYSNMKKQPVKEDRPEAVRARELVLRELGGLDTSRLEEAEKTTAHANRTAMYIDVMPGKEASAISFIVDGRTVWQDITVSLTKEGLKQSGPDGLKAFEVCMQLVTLAVSHPASEDPTLGVGPFLIWTGYEDQEAWSAILCSWSS
jgi:hypothetical protein